MVDEAHHLVNSSLLQTAQLCLAPREGSQSMSWGPNSEGRPEKVNIFSDGKD